MEHAEPGTLLAATLMGTQEAVTDEDRAQHAAAKGPAEARWGDSAFGVRRLGKRATPGCPLHPRSHGG